MCAQDRLTKTTLQRGGGQDATPQVWHFCGHSGDSENAKTPLCNSWRHGFARSRGDQTICGARGGACSSGFLFRKAVSDLRRPGTVRIFLKVFFCFSPNPLLSKQDLPLALPGCATTRRGILRAQSTSWSTTAAVRTTSTPPDYWAQIFTNVVRTAAVSFMLLHPHPPSSSSSCLSVLILILVIIIVPVHPLPPSSSFSSSFILHPPSMICLAAKSSSSG